MINHELILSDFQHIKDKKLMNRTLNSFGNFKNNKNMPILTSIQCQSSDYEFKFNKTHYKNRIESITNKSAKNTKIKTDLNHEQLANKQILYSLKHFNLNSGNNINFINFNNTVSNAVNHDFHGKKISLSKHPLLYRNKFINTNNNNLEINSTLFGDKINETEKNNFDKVFNNKIIYKTGDCFSTKIENDIKKMLNKTKDNNINSFENSKINYINQNKYFDSVMNLKNNNSNIKYIETDGNIFLKENKMKLVKKRNHNTIKLINKNRNNNYITPTNMFRKVLYIDQNNKTISNDKTLNLLRDEKDFINENLNAILYYVQNSGKGKHLDLPLLIQQNQNLKKQNGKFLTEFGKNLDELYGHSNKRGKLGQLIKDRFTMNNYKSLSPSRMNSGLIEYSIKTKFNESTYHNENYHSNSNSNNIFRKIIANTNNAPSRKRRKEKNKNNMLNDILGLIKSKVIESPVKNSKINNTPKKEESEIIQRPKIVRKNIRAMSRMENVINEFNLINEFFGEKDKMNSTMVVKDIKGNNIKVKFKLKENETLTPINEEGEAIKDMRLIQNIYGLTKKQLAADAEERLFNRRYSVNIRQYFKNPLIILEQEENKEDDSKLIINENKEDNYNGNGNGNDNNKDNNKENIIAINKINEEKEKEKKILEKKEKDKKYNKILSSLQKAEKKQNKVLTKSIKIKTKSNLKKSLHIKNPHKINNISPIKNIVNNNNNVINNNNNDISKIKVEPEINEQTIKQLLNDIKNSQNESIAYNEEDDFIKDFNFDFYSSGEENEALSYQKKLRNIRKKKNKHLFTIFNFIAKNTDFSKSFTKSDLIKYLINDDFRFNFEQLKEQIAKGRLLSYNSIYTNGIGEDKKIYIRDLEIINYLYRYIEDKDSIFYRAVYHPKNRKPREGEITQSYNDKLKKMLGQNGNEDFKKRKRFSVFYRRPTKNYLEDKYKINKKKSEKKKKSHKQNAENEVITQSEKKLLMLNEINLTNELKYQISIANDKESREKFKNLLNKIEALRNLDSNEYVRSLKKNYEMYKEEVNEIIKAKEIEERLNGFIDSLNYQRNNLKDKHKYIMSSLYIKDNKFSSTLENNLNESN